MSDLSVSERRIKPIQDAVETENWKQALQLCEKWQKKGERSDRFQAIKAFVLVKQQDKSLRERGISETTQLCKRTPPITDLETIHQVQATLAGLSIRGGESTRLWERAIAATPDSKELPMTWLHESIHQDDWLNAQKAAMALRKGFPKDRNYDFWNVLMCYLIHKDHSLPEENRKLFGTLAYRLISKAAEAVPSDPTQLLSSGKAIQTAEELYLLVNIYLSTGHSAEAAALLRSDNLGLKSRFAKQDSQLVNSLLLDCLEASKAWEELFALCQILLHDNEENPGGTFDDYRVWELLIKSANASMKTGFIDDASKIISANIDGRPSLRNAHRANLALRQAKFLSGSSIGDMLDQCKHYFEMFSEKKFCFEDLRYPVNGLDQPHQQEFLEYLGKLPSVSAGHGKTDKNNLQSSLNALKLEYCFSLSAGAAEKDLEDFAAKALHMYQNSLAERDSCPEAALLSAMALVRLAYFCGLNGSRSSRDTHLLQAAFLLQDCLIRTDDYFPYRILLLQVELMLGLVSLSMKRFKQLSIKNLQWETVGYLILTRISTSHPHNFGKANASDDAVIDPLPALHTALTVTDGSGNSLARQIQSGLRHGSYVNVMESLDMRSDLKHSMSKEIFSQEKIRVNRILNLVDNEEVHNRRSPLVDKRDFSYLPDFEAPNSRPFMQYLHCGPVPKELWLNACKLYDSTLRLLKGELYGHSMPFNQQLEAISHLFELLTHSLDRQVEELTNIEVFNLRAHLHLAAATKLMKENGYLESTDKASFEVEINKIEKWMQDILSEDFRGVKGSPEDALTHLNSEVLSPSWAFLHWEFSVIETIQGIALFLAVLAKKPKSSKSKAAPLSKERISTLHKQVGDVEKRIHEDARKLKATINAPGVLGLLLETGLARSEDDEQSAFGKQLEELTNAASLETYCGAIRDSWEDALDGILAVKVKNYK